MYIWKKLLWDVYAIDYYYCFCVFCLKQLGMSWAWVSFLNAYGRVRNQRMVICLEPWLLTPCHISAQETTMWGWVLSTSNYQSNSKDLAFWLFSLSFPSVSSHLKVFFSYHVYLLFLSPFYEDYSFLSYVHHVDFMDLSPNV